MRWKRGEVTGWGRTLRAQSLLARPERLSELPGIFETSGSGGLSILAGGRSYGDSALNSGGSTCLTGRLDRILAFDENTGAIEVEPGVTFHKLLDVFLPRGWLFPVTPGTGFVTIGGAVAHDVHGKNHQRDGTFGQHVTELDLVTPKGLRSSISPMNDPDAFRATCGGCGLTGLITRVAFRMRRVPSAFVEVKERRIANLGTFLEAFEDAKHASYSVAWIDAMASGAKLGRGLIQVGEPSCAAPASMHKRRPHKVPFDLPAATLNPFTVRSFNALYLRQVPKGGRTRPMHYAHFLYPLDAIADWNRVYGRPGFHQFQCVVPVKDSEQTLRRMLELVAASQSASALSVLKRMGPGRAGYLSFPMDGYTLALDFSNGKGAAELYRQLADIALNCGGRVYLAKDALLSHDAFARMYPALPNFQRAVNRLDPDGLFRSDMARRLRITA